MYTSLAESTSQRFEGFESPPTQNVMKKNPFSPLYEETA